MRTFITLLWLASAAVAVMPAAAQDYPSRPIHIIAPFGPGTATDTVARVVAAELTRLTGQATIVDNRPGAEGQIGAQAAATAAPDGYTIFVTTQTTQSINQHVYKKLPYDPVKSFEPISGLSGGAQIVLVRNDLPVKTIPEFIALAQAQPGKLTFGSGNGSAFLTRPRRRSLPTCLEAASTSPSVTSRPRCRRRVMAAHAASR